MSKHRIPVDEALALIQAHADQHGPYSEESPRSFRFDMSILHELAFFDGEYIRVHHALHHGKPTVVLIVYDEKHEALAAVQYGEPCPPFC